jgi:RNA polymerase subunit RPABC4/transcription elongation factor Spt4
MAKLTTCKACGGQVARSAKRCPHCGHRRHTIWDTLAIILGLIAIAIFIGLIWPS